MAADKQPALFIGSRYASLGSRNLLVGFISLLSVAGLALGVAVLITVLSVMNGFDRELRERILALVPHITVTSARNEALSSEADWAPLLDTIRNTEGVTATAPWLQLQGLLLANGRSKGILLNGIDPAQEEQASIISRFTRSGSFDTLTAGAFSIAIGAGLAEELAVTVGDSVMLASTYVSITPLGGFPRQKRFTVGAVFAVGSNIDSNLALVHLQDAQRLYRLGDNIHGYRLQTEDLFGVFALSEQLRKQLPEGLNFSDWTWSYGNIYENIRLSKTLVGLLLSLLVAVAAFNVVVSLVMVVKGKQGDIAILRAMGCSLATIRRIFLVQGFCIGLIGTGAGLLLGLGMSLLASDFVAWLENLLGIAFLSADIYPVNYLPTEIRGIDLVLVGAFALLLCLLATLYPAARAAQVRPAEVLRYE